MPGGMSFGGMGGPPFEFSQAGGGAGGGAPKRRAEPVEYNFSVSLEDLYTGATKRMRITKKVWDADSNRPLPVAVEKEIPIK